MEWHGENVVLQRRRGGGQESVDDPLCILLQGRENDIYCKCSALWLGYPVASLLCWARQCPQSAVGMDGLTQLQHIPLSYSAVGFSIALSCSYRWMDGIDDLSGCLCVCWLAV